MTHGGMYSYITKDHRIYRAITDAVRNCTRKEHQEHLEEISNHLHTDQSIFWRWLKNLRGVRTTIPTLNLLGKTLTSAADKASAFNEYFMSVFTKEKHQNLDKLCTRLSTRKISAALEDIDITEQDVYKLLCRTDPSKACGPDEIPGRLLKEKATCIAEPLTKLFNMSVQCGTLPSDWKKANVSPIFKKGNKHNPQNYRPISLTSLVIKVLERVLHNAIMDFLNENNLISNNQHGFRKHHSSQNPTAFNSG